MRKWVKVEYWAVNLTACTYLYNVGYAWDHVCKLSR
jgi:hypothetical protein